MSFMELELTRKGATYSAECSKCGATMYTQEWAYCDHNERRDAMENGTLRCDECCIGRADTDTFTKERNQYACRYSAPGYLDCTDWNFGINKRQLERDVREMYGEN
jgi:hypothetical protein